MQTVDDEFPTRTKRFIGEAVKAGEPFFAWYAPTRMHIDTHLRPGREKLGAPHSSELDVYGSGMIEHDMQEGGLLEALHDIGIADNTIVINTTDNGAMESWWPDGGATPFRGEKAKI